MNITEEKLLEYLSKALVCVAVIVIGYIITRLIIGILRKILNKSRMDGTAEGFVLSVLKVIFYFIVAVTALGTIGVNVASLITALGAAALTAGLALQDLLKNVVSGLVILINKPFVSGNILDFEGVKGTVEEINIFSTTVHTLDNKLVTIPNSRLTSNNVVNCTMVEQRRVDCTFSVSYDDDIDKVREIILNLMATNEMILKDPEPTVRVGEHLDSGVQIKVFAWATPDDYYEVYFFLQENVKKEFDKNGISIEHMPSGIDTMTIFVHKDEFEEKEQQVLAGIHKAVNPDHIELESDLALIAIVGRGMRSTRGTAGRIFSALAHAHINVKMIDQGSSELNIIVGVRHDDFKNAIRALYQIFVETQI